MIKGLARAFPFMKGSDFMKQHNAHNIKNVALVGHGGAGKTSLAEAMLYITGVSDRLGKVIYFRRNRKTR